MQRPISEIDTHPGSTFGYNTNPHHTTRTATLEETPPPPHPPLSPSRSLPLSMCVYVVYTCMYSGRPCVVSVTADISVSANRMSSGKGRRRS